MFLDRHSTCWAIDTTEIGSDSYPNLSARNPTYEKNYIDNAQGSRALYGIDLNLRAY